MDFNAWKREWNEEFSLSVLKNAASPCCAGRDQKRISEQRAVPLSRVRLLWTWVTKEMPFLDSSISCRNVAAIICWEKTYLGIILRVNFESGQMQHGECVCRRNLHFGTGAMLQQRWMRATSRQLWANSSDNLSGEFFSNICLPPGWDIKDFKHKPNLCCQLCDSGSFFQEVWQAESNMLLCCQAWTLWDSATRDWI